MVSPTGVTGSIRPRMMALAAFTVYALVDSRTLEQQLTHGGAHELRDSKSWKTAQQLWLQAKWDNCGCQ